MENERKAMRLGLLVIFCAAFLRLAVGSGLGWAVELLGREEVAALVLYLESGRAVRPAPQTTQEATPETTPQAIPQTSPPQTTPVRLTAQDAALVTITNHTQLKPDLEQLLVEAQFPQLKTGEPAVLIVHTHGSESYMAQSAWVEVSPYRTLDNNYNMVSIGEAVAQRLRQEGIVVIHDTTLHDQPDYNAAYSSSRAAVKDYLEQYPSIQLVLDIHRDANSDYVNQLSTSALVDGEDSVQLMMVVGTGHERWQQNMSCAVQLHAWMEKSWPGLCRPISFREGRFNQDLLPGMLLVEVGGAGDDHAQALVAAEALAQAIIELSTGSSTR